MIYFPRGFPPLPPPPRFDDAPRPLEAPNDPGQTISFNEYLKFLFIYDEPSFSFK